jgi:hypothetical protein
LSEKSTTCSWILPCIRANSEESEPCRNIRQNMKTILYLNQYHEKL